jgi:hypothetical protein
MEEGFDGTLTDLEARFRKTYGQIVIDLQDYSESIADHNKWF